MKQEIKLAVFLAQKKVWLIRLGKVTKLYLPNESSLAEAKQACNWNLQKAGKVVIWNLGTAIQALMHKQGQAFGVCLANEVS